MKCPACGDEVPGVCAGPQECSPRYEVDCDNCGDEVLEDGCGCDGHAFCASCLDQCPACLASMRDDFYPDRTY